MRATAGSNILKTRVLPAVVGLVLLVVVVLDTEYVSPAEFRRMNPPAFNGETYARETFPKIAAQISQKATDITELAPAIDDDLAAAGEQYGQELGSNQYSFPVKASGTVREVDEQFILLDVDGLTKGTQVRIPLGTALNGTPVRDATGSITYGDFTDQTEYQTVANQFKLRMQEDVLAALETEGLEGKELTVEGGYNTGGPPDSYIIQPTRIEVGA